MAEEKEIDRLERDSDSFLRDILDNLDQYAFGIITQHGYRELEGMLNNHAIEIEKKFHRWFVRGLAAFAIMALGVVLGLIGYGILLSKQNALIHQLKVTRSQFVYDSCVAQSKRHDETVTRLVRAGNKAEQAAPSPRVRAKIHDSVNVSISLIDALQPKQDCRRLAAVSVGDAKPPPPDIQTR